MKEEDIEVAIKVVIVGNGAVGKSSMIQRYCKGIFTKDYKKTIGVDFLERQIEFNDEDVRLMLWDTAGQEEFDAITKSYYRGAQAGVLVFSTVDRDSFEAIDKWRVKVEDEVGNIPLVLVQNKIDLVEQAVLEPEEAEALAKRMKLRFYRTSVKENLNVEDVFRYLTERYIERIHSTEPEDNSTISAKIGIFNTSTTPSMQSEKNGNDSNPTIQLKPMKQRTKGKKSALKCSLL
ncbi:ras-related protein Rab-23 [Strongylocentrotus purpuratus]|uniref:Ras-related protein Rab-23 n=1 Tax=Strongylocentrotus purpuratus TaxID=7668 RepID=A0A7M7NP75_STRPU|nr:ras-related protein Rab-23 [Strongylocentrotus purpuratus]|eukprot:XP_003729499.1 PREDICTED: ras-related protein Rab-23 isoform X2 [Strongylocentrotus purpuratus]